jgi:hypothetical protein
VEVRVLFWAPKIQKASASWLFSFLAQEAKCLRTLRCSDDAAIFLVSLAIRGQCLKIWSDDGSNTTALCLAGDRAGPRFALTKRFLKALDRNRKTDFVSVSEAISNGLGYAEHPHRYPFNEVRLDTISKQALSESYDT